MQTPARTRHRVRLRMRAEAAHAATQATGLLLCRDTDAGELPSRTGLRGAGQLICWARFTMRPSVRGVLQVQGRDADRRRPSRLRQARRVPRPGRLVTRACGRFHAAVITDRPWLSDGNCASAGF